MIQDTLAAVVDTLPIVVDSVKVAVDGLAGQVGTLVGAQVAAWVSLGLGLLVKVVVDLAKKASAKFAAAPDIVKSLGAVLFGQAAAWVTAKTGFVVSADIGALDATLTGIVLAAVAMGIHGLSKVIKSATE